MIGKTSLLNLASLAVALSAGSSRQLLVVVAPESDVAHAARHLPLALVGHAMAAQARPEGYGPLSRVSTARITRQRYGNKPGKYVPHQGKREMARRVRNIALGRYNNEQLA